MDANDLQFEEEIQRNPYNLKVWTNYLSYKTQQTYDSGGKCGADVFIIYERALKCLPRSYKLWHAYLKERAASLSGTRITSQKYKILINTYERAIVHMNKMPRIWIEYCELMMSLRKGTGTRKTFDRALQALPITQHSRIWDLYITWATEYGVAETAIRVYRRFLMIEPSRRESFVDYLETIGQFGEAARQLADCLNDDRFVSPTGKTQHQMWMHLCDICAANPKAVVSTLNVEAIIRSGITRFSDEVARLWNSLADYYIRLGQFEKARDIYEEGINSVTTVRDFTIIFDEYIKVEEAVLTTKVRFIQEKGGDDDLGDESQDIEMRLARVEYLVEKRPVMLNSVVLRQNPHNVYEWHKRVKLYDADKPKKLLTYIEAVKTVDAKLAVGRLSGLWLGLARYYEQEEDLSNARAILEQATKVNYKTVEELANVWCGWAEFEMRLEEYENAFAVMKQAVLEPTMSASRRQARAVAQGRDKSAENFEGVQVSDRLHKNMKVWSLYLDLEENLGSVETCRAAYDKAMDLKVITAQMCLNYASYLEERNFFEDCFRVYERSVGLFGFPQVKVIWNLYIEKFTARYEGTKLERLRDMFEQSVIGVPAADAAEFYLRYAKAEEQYGLARHAMGVYDRATRAVPTEEKLDMYRLYIKKVETHFGVTRTRPVYERAIKELRDNDSREMCLEFADMERKVGEIDRARAIYNFGSQFADPRREKGFWASWRGFEESHGNEDTFREMLRMQRSVETSFSQVNYLASEMMAGSFVQEEKAAAAAAAAVAATHGANSLEAMEFEAERAAVKRKFDDMADNGKAFVAAATFDGPRPGYSFKAGLSGVGYYLENEQEAAAAGGGAETSTQIVVDSDEIEI